MFYIKIFCLIYSARYGKFLLFPNLISNTQNVKFYVLAFRSGMFGEAENKFVLKWRKMQILTVKAEKENLELLLRYFEISHFTPATSLKARNEEGKVLTLRKKSHKGRKREAKENIKSQSSTKLLFHILCV
jgi:hypothetical protein